MEQIKHGHLPLVLIGKAQAHSDQHMTLAELVIMTRTFSSVSVKTNIEFINQDCVPIYLG